MNIPRRSQFSGCLIGQCVGDAAGFIVEGHNPDICGRYVDNYSRSDKFEDMSDAGFSFGQLCKSSRASWESSE